MAKKDFKADALEVLDFGSPQVKEEPRAREPQEIKESRATRAAQESKQVPRKPGRPKKAFVPTIRFTLLLTDANNQYLEKVKKVENLAGYEVINKIIDEHREANEPLLDKALEQLEQSLKSWKL